MALATRPKPQTYHKKRQAQHHKKSKHYLKPYWPYLPMLIIVGMGFAVNNFWTSRASVLGASNDFSDTTLLQTTNRDRLDDKLAALTLNSQLTAAAQAKANDMAAKNYWSHTTPDGNSPWTFITATGYQYQTAGENLAYGFSDAKDTIAGWMNSPEHRENVLNHSYTQVGFGVVHAANYQGKGQQTIVVAEYAEPVASVANISFTVDNPSSVSPPNTSTDVSARPVSRIQVLTDGEAAWSLGAVSAMAGAALALFIVRHGLRLKKLFVEGETFIAHHALLDIVIVFVFTTGFVLTRTSGVIR